MLELVGVEFDPGFEEPVDRFGGGEDLADFVVVDVGDFDGLMGGDRGKGGRRRV